MNKSLRMWRRKQLILPWTTWSIRTHDFLNAGLWLYLFPHLPALTSLLLHWGHVAVSWKLWVQTLRMCSYLCLHILELAPSYLWGLDLDVTCSERTSTTPVSKVVLFHYSISFIVLKTICWWNVIISSILYILWMKSLWEWLGAHITDKWIGLRYKRLDDQGSCPCKIENASYC